MCLHLPPQILVLFLYLDWTLVNLPMKSLASNMSNDREANRSITTPSWPWFWWSRSWSCPWLREWPLQWSEVMLSAPRLVVLPTSSRDMSPRVPRVCPTPGLAVYYQNCPSAVHDGSTVVSAWKNTKEHWKHFSRKSKMEKDFNGLFRQF